MDENTSPPSRVHPTIYYVNLGRVATTLWEALPQYRASKLALWQQRAKAAGKKTIEVYGKYCRLGQFDVKEAL